LSGRPWPARLNLIHEVEQKGKFVTALDPYASTRGEMGHLVIK
jgi:hypothetical protein